MSGSEFAGRGRLPARRVKMDARLRVMKTTRLTPAFFVLTAFLLGTLVSTTWAAFGYAAASDLPARDTATPVLVELFTSEGCSSCPPADALLGKLDGSQPIAGAQVIVLSEHVDYWNHDGWKDSYSSSFFTARQGNYGRRFRLNSVYTPQMVVDGSTQLNGSDAAAVARAIEGARSHFKLPVRISSVSVANPTNLRVHVAVDALPSNFKARKAVVFVVVALNRAESHVLAGENKGRDIRHVAVAESMDKVGAVDKGRKFDRDVVVKVKSTADLANLRLIAFVQEADGGEVVGASLLSAPLH